MRACIFIDGDSLREVFRNLEFIRNEDYLPPKAKWADLFRYICSDPLDGQVVPSLVRAYWYVPKKPELLPEELPIVEFAEDYDQQERERILIGHVVTNGELSRLGGSARQNKITELFEALSRAQTSFLQRFEDTIIAQERLQLKEMDIEFRRAGVTQYEVVKNRPLGEEGVTIGLVSDLITLAEIYDVAYIISSDRYLAPAIHAVKQRGRKVINVVFAGPDGKARGLSRALSLACDRTRRLEYSKIQALVSGRKASPTSEFKGPGPR